MWTIFASFNWFDSWFGIEKLNFPMFFMIYTTAQLGDISVMFRRCLLSGSILRLFSRILFFEFLFQPSLSQNIFSTFLTHISVLVRRFIRLLVTCPQSCNYAYSWGIISTENSSCKLIKCHYIRDWKLEILNGWHFMFHVNWRQTKLSKDGSACNKLYQNRQWSHQQIHGVLWQKTHIF